MVQLDHQLLYSARRLFTAANVHRLKEMIFAYEQAVALHNRQWPKHEVYRIQIERRLRNYVRQCQMTSIRTRPAVATARARTSRASTQRAR